MTRTVLALGVALLCALGGGGVAVAQPLGCAERADVSWDADWDTVLLEGVTVDVPGCADRVIVGLELLGHEGELLPEPLFAEVVSERAVFDVSGPAIGIEPVTGVRVTIEDGADDGVDPDDLEPPGDDGGTPDGGGTDDGGTDGGGTDGGRADDGETDGGAADGATDDGGRDEGGPADGAGDSGASAGRTPLPRTGVDVLIVLAFGLALLVLGGSFMTTRRRTRGLRPRR